MKKQNVIRTILFVTFFGIGFSCLSLSILANELLALHNKKVRLRSERQYSQKLKSLSDDYEAVLNQLEQDPQMIERIAPVTLGTEPSDANAVYPKASAERLAVAEKVLSEEQSGQLAESQIGFYLNRCSSGPKQTVLFLSGAFLVMISFSCFGSGIARRA